MVGDGNNKDNDWFKKNIKERIKIRSKEELKYINNEFNSKNKKIKIQKKYNYPKETEDDDDLV